MDKDITGSQRTPGHNLRDPHLTGEGQRQCREQRDKFPRHEHIELVCASPLRRALQTSLITFSPAISQHNLRVLALPLAEESSNAPMDTGSDVRLLTAEFGPSVDFSLVVPAGADPAYAWYRHEGKFGTQPSALIARAAELRRWLRDRPEKEIALASHGFFNHYLAGEVNAQGEQTTPWWAEAEIRTYEFLPEGQAAAWEGGAMNVQGEEVAMIRETEESLFRRGGKRDGEEGARRKSVNVPAERPVTKGTEGAGR